VGRVVPPDSHSVSEDSVRDDRRQPAERVPDRSPVGRQLVLDDQLDLLAFACHLLAGLQNLGNGIGGEWRHGGRPSQAFDLCTGKHEISVTPNTRSMQEGSDDATGIQPVCIAQLCPTRWRG
jgi:hypothetical protein